MLHGWTEYDAIRAERDLLEAALIAKAGQEAIRHANATRIRATFATALVWLATRVSPSVTVEQPRYKTAAHA